MSLYDFTVAYFSEDTYIVTTSSELNYDQYWITVTGEHSFVFKVMACHDVHLAIGAVPGNSETLAYEVCPKICPEVCTITYNYTKSCCQTWLKSGPSCSSVTCCRWVVSSECSSLL